MEITPGKRYKLKESPTLRDKYGDVLDEGYWLEDEHTNIWPPDGWGMQQGNPACLIYAMRGAAEGLGAGYPYDNTGRVFYGKIGFMGELVHESEILEELEIAEDN